MRVFRRCFGKGFDVVKIAEWKINTDEEAKLAKAAEASKEGRQKYVAFYRDANQAYYKKGLDMAREKFREYRFTLTGGVVEDDVVEDMIYSLHRFGCMFDEYFTFGFYYLNTKGRDSYITDKLRWLYYEKFNDPANNHYFDNKIEAYRLLGDFYHRDAIAVSSKSDMSEFEWFFRKHDNFIVKPLCFGTGKYQSSGGKGVYLCETPSVLDNSFLLKLASSGDVICEELIVQDDELAVFHKESVNSIRVPSFRTKEGIKILHPYLRVGVGNSVIDNACAGGIYAFIDEDSGIVISEGFDRALNRYVRHPDSETVFPGYEIPKWKELKGTIDDLFKLIDGTNYVAWDMSLSHGEWTVIEANVGGQLDLIQSRFGGIKPVLDDFLDCR
jgi:hypothetical protein